MRKHKSRTVDQIQEIHRVAKALYDARVDANVTEYTRLLTVDPDLVDVEEMKQALAEARANGFPKYIVPKKTVEDAPQAKGSFKW